MKLIDIHTHIYPPAIARKAAASIREFYQLGTEEMDGTAETLLQRGDEAGIDRFVILPVSMRPERTRHINDFILSQVAVQPRFLGFGTTLNSDLAQHIVPCSIALRFNIGKGLSRNFGLVALIQCLLAGGG